MKHDVLNDLALSLFVTGIVAYDAYFSLTFDNLTFITDSLYRSSHFHGQNILIDYKNDKTQTQQHPGSSNGGDMEPGLLRLFSAVRNSPPI